MVLSAMVSTRTALFPMNSKMGAIAFVSPVARCSKIKSVIVKLVDHVGVLETGVFSGDLQRHFLVVVSRGLYLRDTPALFPSTAREIWRRKPAIQQSPRWNTGCPFDPDPATSASAHPLRAST